MKAIDLSTTTPTLAEILDLAGEDNVILRTPEGRQFVLAEIDDFGDEVERTGRNKALARLLGERSAEKATLSVDQVRQQLRGKKPRRGGGRKPTNGER
jgi:hypothetical protein